MKAALAAELAAAKAALAAELAAAKAALAADLAAALAALVAMQEDGFGPPPDLLPAKKKRRRTPNVRTIIVRSRAGHGNFGRRPRPQAGEPTNRAPPTFAPPSPSRPPRETEHSKVLGHQDTAQRTSLMSSPPSGHGRQSGQESKPGTESIWENLRDGESSSMCPSPRSPVIGSPASAGSFADSAGDVVMHGGSGGSVTYEGDCAADDEVEEKIREENRRPPRDEALGDLKPDLEQGEGTTNGDDDDGEQWRRGVNAWKRQLDRRTNNSTTGVPEAGSLNSKVGETAPVGAGIRPEEQLNAGAVNQSGAVPHIHQPATTDSLLDSQVNQLHNPNTAVLHTESRTDERASRVAHQRDSNLIAPPTFRPARQSVTTVSVTPLLDLRLIHDQIKALCEAEGPAPRPLLLPNALVAPPRYPQPSSKLRDIMQDKMSALELPALEAFVGAEVRLDFLGVQLDVRQIQWLFSYWLEREVFLLIVLLLHPCAIAFMVCRYYETSQVRRNATHFRGYVVDAELKKKNAALSSLENSGPLNSLQEKDRQALVDRLKELNALKTTKGQVDAPIVPCRLCGGYIELVPTQHPYGYSCRVCCKSFGSDYLQSVTTDQISLRNKIHRDQMDPSKYKYAGEKKAVTTNAPKTAYNHFAYQHPDGPVDKIVGDTFDERQLKTIRERIHDIFSNEDVFKFWLTAMLLLGPRSDALLYRDQATETCERCKLGGFTTLTGTHCVLCRRTYSARHVDPELYYIHVSHYRPNSWREWAVLLWKKLQTKPSDADLTVLIDQLARMMPKHLPSDRPWLKHAFYLRHLARRKVVEAESTTK